MEQLRQIVADISMTKHGTIRSCTGLPDYSGIPIPEYYWDTYVYGKATEEVPIDCPNPLVKKVILTSFVAQNLYRNHTPLGV